MNKDFDNWNNIKKSIDLKNRKILFKEMEIWWCSVGLNIGIESCGKGISYTRPVLIFTKLSNYSFIGIPLSTKNKESNWWHKVHFRRLFHNTYFNFFSLGAMVDARKIECNIFSI